MPFWMMQTTVGIVIIPRRQLPCVSYYHYVLQRHLVSIGWLPRRQIPHLCSPYFLPSLATIRSCRHLSRVEEGLCDSPPYLRAAGIGDSHHHLQDSHAPPIEQAIFRSGHERDH